MSPNALKREVVFPEEALPKAAELLVEGRSLAKDWRLEKGAFLKAKNCDSEAQYKRQQADEGRLMQHAQVGFRDPRKSAEAYTQIYEGCAEKGVTVDRYGICLDWSMGYPRQGRDKRPKGTGLILEGPEDYAALTKMAPVAPHFGDFVLGFPAAVENTQAALSAGCSAIGNMGQFFTFRLPHWDDDLALTKATVTALGLIAAQEAEILVHSNLDDGFAALFTDLASCLGAAMIERHIVEDLIGARMSHCFGHHFSNPVTRLAFQTALKQVGDAPGTMIYGNTTSYKGTEAENYASLANYLLSDIAGQRQMPSGHALNPVPVSENLRIPDLDEIIDAQLFAARLIEQATDYDGMIDASPSDALAQEIVAGGKRFYQDVLMGLSEAGIDCGDAFELMLALRRIGPKRLEELYGPGEKDDKLPHGRKPIVPATTIDELNSLAETALAAIEPKDRRFIGQAGLKLLVATSDVHEHGKLLVEQVFTKLGIEIVDGGVSSDPDDLAKLAARHAVSAIAISTYNGIALRFLQELQQELNSLGQEIPILIGGRLNQIPEATNSSLPVDVSDALAEAGAIVCQDIRDAAPALLDLCRENLSSSQE